MGTDRPNGSLYTKIENQVAAIEFGHPASNSFTSELLERLTKELQKLAMDPLVSVIVLKSEGNRAFCAGASFDELVAISNLEEGKAFLPISLASYCVTVLLNSFSAAEKESVPGNRKAS